MNTQSGFLKAIVLIIIAIILLKYFLHIDIVGYFSTHQFQQNIATVKMWFNEFYTWLDINIVKPFVGK